MKITGFKFSPTVQFLHFVARHCNVSVETVNVAWSEAERRAELKPNSPSGTFPYLTCQNGNVSQSFAIARFFCEQNNAALLGADNFQRAQVMEWCEFARNEIRSKAKSIVYPIFGHASSEGMDNDMKALKEHVQLLNKHLESRKYVCGDNLTLADLVLAFELRMFFQFCFVENMRKSLFPKVTEYLVNILSTEHAQRAFGRFILCKNPLKAPKVEKKKEEPKKKEEKPKEVVAEEKPKKKANPMDSLPPSSLVLDDWKRDFLNRKDQDVAMQEFWNSKFDPAGYSLWHMHYEKLPSEGKILFKTNNSSSFFLQKLDNFRKYSFATHGVYGVEGAYEIRGCWMWRGTEVAEQMAEHDNYPYMKVRRLDHTKEEDRKLVEAYWLKLKEGDEVDGMPVAEVTQFR